MIGRTVEMRSSSELSPQILAVVQDIQKSLQALAPDQLKGDVTKLMSSKSRVRILAYRRPDGWHYRLTQIL